MYIRNRHSPGLGYFGQTSPEELEGKAAAKDNEARIEFDSRRKIGLQNDAISLRAQAAAERARLAEVARSSQATRELATNLTATAATIGTSLLASRDALKLAKIQAKTEMARAAAGPGTTVIHQGGGLSTGAMVGIGVGVAALLVVVLVVTTKK